MEAIKPRNNAATKNKTAGRPFAFWPMIILVFLIGVSATISGPLLFLAPDGHWMQWSAAEMLKGTPFSDFLIPGIILFLFIGIFPIFGGLGLATKTDWKGPEVINPFKQYHWSWTAALAVGLIMLMWIAVETLLLGYISPLQPIILGWGILIIVLTLLPDNRRYYQNRA